MQPLKRRFLVYELGLLTVRAALSTRDEGWPIYKETTSQRERAEAQDAFRAILEELDAGYAGGGVSEPAHNRLIVDVADRLTAKLKPSLHKDRFRIGVSQKLVNLYLKYLWVAGLCPEPPHCPIDGIVRDIARID